MKAVALTRCLPIDNPEALLDLDLPAPDAPKGHDLLVRIEAVAVNPVDTKIRRSKLGATEDPPRILGWDAAGTVEAVGPDVSRFRPGDAVYYSGSLSRPGANCQIHLVDERIVGFRPRSLSVAECAALPLTALTAWEALFDRLRIDSEGADSGKSLLILGSAGGVGSIAIQLARLAGLTTIASASRPETQSWVTELGAHHVINHRHPIEPQLQEIGHPEVDFIANFSDTDAYWKTMANVIRPLGAIVGIVENTKPIELGLLKSKSASFVWEFMATRPIFQTPDMSIQGQILDRIANLADEQKIRSTLTKTLSPINAANLRAVHAKLESGSAIGKIVLTGWD